MMNGLSRSLFLPLRVLAVSAALVNRTIDDYFGDRVTGVVPTYQPTGSWAQGNICSTCNINTGIIDVDRVHNGTWHDSTYRPSQPESTIAVTFTGQAVYVFNLIVNSLPKGTITLTALTFYVDGELSGNYSHTPDNSPDVLYDVPVFSARLPHGPHTLSIRSGGSSVALVLFDYIIYTTDDGVEPQGADSPSSPMTQAHATTEARTEGTSEIPSSTVSGYGTSSPIGPDISSGSLPTDTTQATSPARSSLSSTSLAAISGGVAGAAMIVFVVACWMIARRRRRRRQTLAQRTHTTVGFEPRPHSARSAEQMDALDLPITSPGASPGIMNAEACDPHHAPSLSLLSGLIQPSIFGSSCRSEYTTSPPPPAPTTSSAAHPAHPSDDTLVGHPYTHI
ncbi:hypothetical protein C8Q73DRAFT_364946 [Cubamyces lactineus]|nr:hypothetical protein C8Q73DRAFT_364946 [Cubamyces lactineus]